VGTDPPGPRVEGPRLVGVLVTRAHPDTCTWRPCCLVCVEVLYRGLVPLDAWVKGTESREAETARRCIVCHQMTTTEVWTWRGKVGERG